MAARERCDVSGAPAVKWQAELTISKWETGSRKTGAHVTHPLAELGEVAEDGGSEVTREFFVRKMVFLLNVLCVSAGKDERAEFLRQELSGSYRKSHAERIVHQVFLQLEELLAHKELQLTDAEDVVGRMERELQYNSTLPRVQLAEERAANEAQFRAQALLSTLEPACSDAESRAAKAERWLSEVEAQLARRNEVVQEAEAAASAEHEARIRAMEDALDERITLRRREVAAAEKELAALQEERGTDKAASDARVAALRAAVEHAEGRLQTAQGKDTEEKRNLMDLRQRVQEAQDDVSLQQAEVEVAEALLQKSIDDLQFLRLQVQETRVTRASITGEPLKEADAPGAGTANPGAPKRRVKPAAVGADGLPVRSKEEKATWASFDLAEKYTLLARALAWVGALRAMEYPVRSDRPYRLDIPVALARMFQAGYTDKPARQVIPLLETLNPKP